MEHGVDGPAQLVREYGAGLTRPEAGCQLRPVGGDAVVVLGGVNGGFGEGPREVGVTSLAAGGRVGLAGRLARRADQAGKASKLRAGVEAADGVNLREDGQRGDRADAGDTLEDDQLLGVAVVGRPPRSGAPAGG